MKSTTVVILTRNFRLEDNSVIEAIKSSHVYFVFIMNSSQLEYPNVNKRAIQFMFESLADFAKRASVWLFQSIDDFATWYKGIPSSPIFIMKDYTPFHRQRMIQLREITKLVFPIEDNFITTRVDKTYHVFTPFYKVAELDLRKRSLPEFKVVKADNEHSFLDWWKRKKAETKDTPGNIKSTLIGGRSKALKLLASVDGETPNTMLSAYIKFGCVSVRECAEVFGDALRRQLVWRDFYYQCAEADSSFPDGPSSGTKEDSTFAHIWNGKSISNSRDRLAHLRPPGETILTMFERWKYGNTGYSVIDNAMKQLLAEGYMSNRLRLLVANFAIKDLLLPWKDCELWFAQQLTDYDQVINNYNWQHVAGCGFSHQPWFRIMNPAKDGIVSAKAIVDHLTASNAYLSLFKGTNADDSNDPNDDGDY